MRLTPEQRWINRFKRTLKDMPGSLEIVAYDQKIAICEVGSMREFLDKEVEWGTAEDIETFRVPRLHTHGECI